jgi:hypothetical protein
MVADRHDRHVASGAAPQAVRTRPADEAIVASAADQEVVARAPAEAVVATACEQAVVACAAVEPVGPRRPMQYVVCTGPANAPSCRIRWRNDTAESQGRDAVPRASPAEPSTATRMNHSRIVAHRAGARVGVTSPR